MSGGTTPFFFYWGKDSPSYRETKIPIYGSKMLARPKKCPTFRATPVSHSPENLPAGPKEIHITVTLRVHINVMMLKQYSFLFHFLLFHTHSLKLWKSTSAPMLCTLYMLLLFNPLIMTALFHAAAPRTSCEGTFIIISSHRTNIQCNNLLFGLGHFWWFDLAAGKTNSASYISLLHFFHFFPRMSGRTVVDTLLI